jgi:hypothetical protein
MRIPSFHASRVGFASVVVGVVKSANFVFGIFWNREVIVDRFDSAVSDTTARKWFIG